ncbi:hypothetical protein [Hydrogenophaga sp.]|uniref:hypothetical protein n=1 Tax=Hydrogenophaga sp. TaxID=1904254 RepID=UPI003AF65008
MEVTQQIMSNVDALKIIMLLGIVAATPLCFLLHRSNKELAEKNRRLESLDDDVELGIQNDIEDKRAHVA